MAGLTLIFAAASEPAGGAATADIVIATLGATVLTTLLLALGMGHRSGRVKVLGRLAAWTERKTGLPGWAALPGAISSVALLVALLGMYWDISLHIDQGRDAGPLANPAHYLILAGLFGCFIAGFLAMVLPTERPGRSAVRITRDWHAPVGGVLLFACARVLALRLSPRRLLAPAVRSGRDALGSHPPDADRRRGDDARGPLGAAGRGRAGGTGAPRRRVEGACAASRCGSSAARSSAPS